LGPPGNPDGLFISINDLDRLPEIFENYKASLPSPFLAPEISVITDGSRILGLGDLGVNGMGIPVGKLQLYVGAAGINPSRTLPIALDFGTNNEKFIEDPLYLGLKQARPSDDVFYASVEKVLTELRNAFPSILIQFEDFSSEHAFGLLDKHRNDFFCFNDDIQGTGAVILSGFINAAKQSQVAAKDHKLLFFGAGSAGVGVAKQIMEFFVKEAGLTEEEAKRKFWLVDSKGLVTLDRGDKLAEHKVFFARDDNEGQQFKSVLDVVNYVKPTALVGLSSVSGVFSAEVLQRMAELNERPIVFPLSNPFDKAECTFEQAMINTNNKVIFASGTAFPKFVDSETKEEFVPGQGNNMYIFPGLGLGCILSKPKRITDDIIYAAADSLAHSLTEEERAKNWIYPDINRIREVSAEVAAASIVQAVKEDLVSDKDIIELSKDSSKLLSYVKDHMWKPEYSTLSPKM
jgi:malate dehydrogenase (oxaloacetate-decarboxylating)(NADP+)